MDQKPSTTAIKEQHKVEYGYLLNLGTIAKDTFGKSSKSGSPTSDT